MPIKSEVEHLVLGKYDKRVKLTTEDKKEIIEKYAMGNYSHTSLAKEYGCSRSLISIIVNLVRAQSIKDRFRDNWRKYQKHGEEWALIMREHRAYRKLINDKGLLVKGE